MICKLANIDEINEEIWYEYELKTDSGLYSIMLLKKAEHYIAYQNSCPHQGRRMDFAQGQFLLDESDNIVCPAHGAVFESNSGLCINGPCRGQSLQKVVIQVNDESVFAVIQ